MTEFCGIPLASLRENSITALDLRGKGIGVPGAIVLSKLLPSAAALTSLMCACRPKVFAFLSMPADMLTISPPSPPPLTRSLRGNKIRDKGAFALAAILKETQISNLRCVPPQSVCFCVNAR